MCYLSSWTLEFELQLTDNILGIVRFCVDGLDNLLYACSDGTGFVLDCITKSRRATRGIPTAIAAVIGDPSGGFWLADRRADIHRLDTDGSDQLIWSSKSELARAQELLCTDTGIVWRGWTNDPTESGEERPETLLFFSTDPARRLREIGRRVFSKSEGFIEAMAYDAARQALIVILGNSASASRAMRNGSIEDFIARRERHTPINRVRFPGIAADCTIDSSLYLLGGDGTVFCLDPTSSQQKAVLTPSTPFRRMSTGGEARNLVLVSDGTSNVYLCQKENG